MATGSEIFLTQQQHSELSSIAQSRTLPAGYVFRAKLELLLDRAKGHAFGQHQNLMVGAVVWVKRVVYEPQKQRARLRFLLRNLTKLVNGFSFATTSSAGASAHVELSLLLVLEMTDWACAVKHKAFSEEKEWTVITYPKGATLVGAQPVNYEGVSVRPTAKLLLPYMTLEPPSGKRLPLVEIRCGPSQFQEQSARAMRIVLRKHGHNNLPVTLSEAPLLT
jgi:hypothetical protein